MTTQTTGRSGTDLSRIELELQQRVALARKQYERAIAEVRKLGVESGDRSVRAAGASKLAAALRFQNIATRQYSEALKALSEFVLGQSPRELSKISPTNGSGTPQGA
jgi:hypothetical protein